MTSKFYRCKMIIPIFAKGASSASAISMEINGRQSLTELAEEALTLKSIDNNSHPPQADTVVGASEPDVVRLAGLISAYAPHDGCFELRIPGVHAIRRSRTNTELVHAMAQPALCIVAQGAKSVMLGQEVYEYDESRMIAFSVDLPVTAQITRASYSEPFLAFRLDLDPHKVAELVLKVYPHGLPRVPESRAVYVGQVNVSIVKAATRLLELMAEPGDAELLGPLVIDEILIRLLRSPIGVRVAQIGLAEFRCERNRESSILVAREFLPAHESRRAGRVGAHECFLFPPALQVRHLNEPPAVPKGAASSRGEASHVIHDDGREYCELEGGVSKRFAVQQRIQPLLRECANQGHRQVA